MRRWNFRIVQTCLMSGALLAASTVIAPVAQAAAPVLTVTPREPISGELFTVSGRLTTGNSRPVRLQQFERDAWKTVQKKNSSSSGAFSFTYSTASAISLRVSAPKFTDGDQTSPSETSAPRAIATTQEVDLVLPATVRHGQTLMTKGTFTPVRAGRPAHLQRWQDQAWRTVATGTQDAEGKVVLSLPADTVWSNHYRLVAPTFRGAATAESLPRDVAVIPAWTSVSASYSHTCGLKSDQSLWCWGGYIAAENRYAYLPQRVNNASWLSFSAGSGGAQCGIQVDRTAWCFGSSDRGALGNGSDTPGKLEKDPVPVSGGATWTSLSSGNAQTCGIRTDRSLWCWGANYMGQLGNGTLTDSAVPTQLAGGGSWSSVSTGDDRVCAVKSDRSAWCWGLALGPSGSHEVLPSYTTPQPVAAGMQWLQVGASQLHACGLRTDRSVWCWGLNDTGALGNGDYGRNTSSIAPTRVIGGGAWATAMAAQWNSCGLRTDGSLWCWGSNRLGQLATGEGEVHPHFTPVQALGGTSWKQVSQDNSDHGCGITEDATLWCWGSNEYGQVGNGKAGRDLFEASPVRIND